VPDKCTKLNVVGWFAGGFWAAVVGAMSVEVVEVAVSVSSIIAGVAIANANRIIIPRPAAENATPLFFIPGFVRDLKPYEIALLEGKAITETGEKALNDEAFTLVNGIAGAVLEAGKRLTKELKGKGKDSERDRGGCGR
jgi:hypothetical protein